MRIDNPEDVYMKAFNTLIQGSASDLVLDIAAKHISFDMGFGCGI